MKQRASEPMWKVAVVCSFLALVSLGLGVTSTLFHTYNNGLALTLASVWIFLQWITFIILATHVFEVLTVPNGNAVPDTQPLLFYPKVSIHIPVHSEPVDVVTQTLHTVSKLAYPNFEVLVIDNNTSDPTLWMPVDELCHHLGFRFFHLDQWPGYKAGALNFALKMTSDDASFVAIVDADYHVSPNFLNGLMVHFSSPNIAYVQSPQDYRYVTSSRYHRYCYYAYRYFFDISMSSRNLRNSLIFGGTMGIIRKSALDRYGGWDEFCLTEDAEMGLRVAVFGDRAAYVNHSFGRGLMPFDYTGLRNQRYRWAFGGMQVLLKYWRHLFWFAKPPSERNLTVAQRLDYIMESIHWLEPMTTIANTVLILVIIFTYLIMPHVASEAVPMLFVILALLVAIFRCTLFLLVLVKRSGCAYRDAWGAYCILNSLTSTVSLACTRALLKRRGIFTRTPKCAFPYSNILTALTKVKTDILFGALGILWSVMIMTSTYSFLLNVCYASLCLWNSAIHISSITLILRSR